MKNTIIEKIDSHVGYAETKMLLNVVPENVSEVGNLGIDDPRKHIKSRGIITIDSILGGNAAR